MGEDFGMVRLEVIETAGGPRPPDLDRAWNELKDRCHGNINGMFASPAWYDYMTHAPDENTQPAIIVARDDTDRIVGVVPILRTSSKLRYAIALRNLWTKTLRTAYVLGSLPMLPNDPEPHARLLEAIFDHDPQ